MFRRVLLLLALGLVAAPLIAPPQARAHDRHADHVHLSRANVKAVLEATTALFPKKPKTRLGTKGP